MRQLQIRGAHGVIAVRDGKQRAAHAAAIARHCGAQHVLGGCIDCGVHV